LGEREQRWAELIRAGTIIFGHGFARIAQEGRWRAELRSAYRKRALETHPDRAAALGRSAEVLLRQFREVTEAYALLSGHAGAGREPAAPSSRQPTARPTAPPPSATRPSPPPRPAAAQRPAPQGRSPMAGVATASSAATAVGPLPSRRLRLAEFLYYSGRVSWPQFAAAVAWQRRQRPALGRIAVELGFLDQRAVAQLLERRRQDGAVEVPLGQYAVRRGYLTTTQLLTLLGRQQRQQRRIGTFFTEHGLLGESELEAARSELARHNARVAARAA
jgi:hypothetical protein